MAEEERKRLATKLKEHLVNLDQVEEALKIEPKHGDLQKLKSDLIELIQLVSKEMLKCKPSPGDVKQTTSGSSTNSPPDVINLVDIPNLPSFFYKKWHSNHTQPQAKSKPKPSNADDLDNVSEEECFEGSGKEPVPKKPKHPPRPPGVPRTRNKDLPPEVKREQRKRRSFNVRRNRKIKQFLSNIKLVNGEIIVQNPNSCTTSNSTRT